MKTKFHYHVCSCGRWKCAQKKCNLSSHAKCGFKIGNDLVACRHGKTIAQGLTFDTLAARLIKKEIGRSRFFSDAVRLSMNHDAAKLALREYRKLQRRNMSENAKVQLRIAKNSKKDAFIGLA